MTKKTEHAHPRPTLNRIIIHGALAVTLILLVAALLLALLALTTAPDGFLLVALLTALLGLPVLMLTAITPPVSVSAQGITLQPVIWKEREVGWEAIKAVRVYPLLPTTEEEITRRVAVGRRNYRPAEGIMLVIPSLPAQYRIAGFFTGARSQPVIALTNRAHSDYATLIQTVLENTPPEIHDEDLYDE